MNVLALIPARGGSKGIARKNIADLAGRPLIAWTIEAARSAGCVARVVVSTDDQEIADVALAAGAEVPFRRPPLLSDDAAPALPVIQHAVEWLSMEEGWEAEAIVYLQPTSPFRTHADVEAAMDLLRSRGGDTVVSTVRVPHNMVPSSLMREADGWLEFVVPPEERSFRRQVKELLFARNGPAILINRREVIDRGQLYGERILGYEMDRLTWIDIDEPDDLVLANALSGLFQDRRAGNGS